MPDYDLQIEGETYTIHSDKELSAPDFQNIAEQYAAGKLSKVPPGQILTTTPSYGATFGDLRRIEAGHTTTAENIAQLAAQYGTTPQALRAQGTHAAFEATAQAQKNAQAFAALKGQAIRQAIRNPDLAADYNPAPLSAGRRVRKAFQEAPPAPSTVGEIVNRALGPGTFEALSQMKSPAAGLAQGLLSFAEPESLTLFGGTAPLGLVPGGSLALLGAFGSGAAKGAYQRYQAGDPGGALGELAAFLLPFGIHGARSYAKAGLPLPSMEGRFAPDIGPIGYGGDPALRQMFGLPDLTAPAAAEPAPSPRTRARAPLLGFPEAEPAAPEAVPAAPPVQTSEPTAPVPPAIAPEAAAAPAPVGASPASPDLLSPGEAHAVQVESPAGQVPRPVGAGENLPEGGEGVRPGVEGPEPAGAGVPEAATVEAPKAGEPETGPGGILTAKGANDEAANERETLGLPPLPESERRALSQAWELSLEQNGAADALKNAQKVITNPVNLSDVETAGVVQRMLQLKIQIRDLLDGIADAVEKKDQATADALKQKYDDTLSEYDTLDYARKLAGTEWARAGLARQVQIDEYNFLGVRKRMLAANPQELTEAERTQVADLTSRIADLERRLQEREAAAARAPRKMTRAEQAASGAAFGEGNTVFTREKFDAARDRLRAKLSVPGGGKTNIAANIAELLPDLLEIGGYYAEGLARAGAAKFPAWSKAMRAHFGQDLPLSDADLKEVWDKVRPQIPETKRTMTPEQRLKGATTRKKAAIAELEERIRTGNLEPTKKPRVAINDPEYRKLEQQHARLKKQIDGLIQARQKKGLLGTLTRFQRFALLSGLPTLGKLGAAVTARAISTPLEEAAGGVISKALPRLAAKAPREGGFSPSAELSAIKRMFSKNTLLDMKEKLQTGVNSLDIAVGDKHIVVDRSLLDLWGRVHGAIKTAAQRNEFYRSYVKRLQNAERLGLDWTDPAVHEQITAGAYADSMRAILLGDSWVTQQFSAQLGLMERSGKYGRIPATAARLLIPIAKVPQNYVGEIGQYAGGAAKGLLQTAAAGKFETLKKQGVRKFFQEAIDNLSPDEADSVLRAYKKNSIGAAAIALGYYYGPNVFGTFFTPGQKKPTSGKPGFEDIKIGGVTIPHYLLHNPMFEAMQIGATIRKAMDDRKAGGVGTAIHHVGYGVLTQTPFFEEPIRMGRATESPQATGKILGTMARDVTIPLAVQQAAAALDRQGSQPVQRKARGFREEVMMGIPPPLPFNRTNVPRKTR